MMMPLGSAVNLTVIPPCDKAGASCSMWCDAVLHAARGLARRGYCSPIRQLTMMSKSSENSRSNNSLGVTCCHIKDGEAERAAFICCCSFFCCFRLLAASGATDTSPVLKYANTKPARTYSDATPLQQSASNVRA